MASKRQTRPSPGELLEAVSNLVVKVYADHVGRGPTKARAYADRDIVVCVMEDTMTKAERTLVDAGRGAAVKQVRDALQETMREELTEGVEALTGLRVTAQVGTATLEPDVTSHLFILDGPSPMAAATSAGGQGAGRPGRASRNRPRVV